ncbi:MAG TPA: hypothetical protein VKV95_04435 [Terriglobia bacterium]|nr:hypothetical protein [Terriglobia bacterium]
MADADTHLKSFAEGQTVNFGYLLILQKTVQQCLVDIDSDFAREALKEIALINFSASEGLRAFYEKGVYDTWQLEKKREVLPKRGYGPRKFRRLQEGYDELTPPKIELMIAVLHQVRNKMLGLIPTGEVAKLIRPFPTPDGNKWPNVLIRFTSDFQVQVTVSDKTEVRNYVEMGFEDRRAKSNSKPDRNWEILREFATNNGVIASTKEAADWPKLEKAVQTLNKRLKELFTLSERPIIYDKQGKAYRTRLTLIPPPDDEHPSS